MKRRWIIIAELGLVLALGVWAVAALVHRPKEPNNAIEIKIDLPNVRQVSLAQDSAGALHYTVTYRDGRVEAVSPDEFARRVYGSQHNRGWLEKLCNVTSIWGVVWVAFALVIGQGLFTGRMVIQWLASEKHKRSVVPPLFWWMSLFGSTILLIYFIWRKDIVAVLGQVFGWSIYIRNLLLIYGHEPAPPVTADPGPEPELGK
jgi:lipid-A-disaccharide synthase-like uncharacterized protein